MYEHEMTDYETAAFIKKIIEYSENDHAALELIEAFLENTMTTTEIEDLIF